VLSVGLTPILSGWFVWFSESFKFYSFFRSLASPYQRPKIVYFWLATNGTPIPFFIHYSARGASFVLSLGAFLLFLFLGQFY